MTWEALKISDKLVAATKEREGFSATVYNDRADGKGTDTIGYGTIDPAWARKGVIITKEKATELLLDEMTKKAERIKKMLQDASVPCPSQMLWDVILDFCYNVGEGALLNSTWFRLHLKGKCVGGEPAPFLDLELVGKGLLVPENAADAICMFSKQNHQFVPGLLNRRLCDRNDYLAAVGAPAEYLMDPDQHRPESPAHPAAQAAHGVLAHPAMPVAAVVAVASVPSTWGIGWTIAAVAVAALVIAASVYLISRRKP